MSVMHETSQSAMRPCFSSAEVLFSLNSLTACFRSSLLVPPMHFMNVSSGSEGGEGGWNCTTKDSVP